MKRKINRVGTSTLTVSLPSKWVKEMHLNPGDEIDVETQENHLILTLQPKKQSFSLEADVSGLQNMLGRTVVAMYKAGYHSLDLHFKDPAEASIIQDTVERSCHVFEIMNATDKTIEVRTISDLDPENFMGVYRKIGYAVVEMADDMLRATRDRDVALMHAVILKDKLVDRHTDFCRRVMNSGYYVPLPKPFPVYVLVEESEILADMFKTFCREAIDEKLKTAPDVLSLLDQVVQMIGLFYDVMYAFTKEKVRRLGEQELRIRKIIRELGSQRRSDAPFISYISMMFEVAFEMKSALLTLHAEDLAVRR